MTALLAIFFLEGAGAVAVVFAILASIFWLWMLIDCLMNPRLQGTEKIVWVLVVLFLHLLGAVIYFAIGGNEQACRNQSRAVGGSLQTREARHEYMGRGPKTIHAHLIYD